VSTEALRWLALWMAFDDIVRVAALKLAASREQRVRREVQARDDEIVRTYDHFKPGVAEFAALLPARWAARLHDWDGKRVARGQVAWALPLRIGTHTVTGVLALKVLAALKGQRRRGSRYATEQALIDRWLGAVERGAREDAALGLALARCGRLIKGYGSTNERGKANLLHIIDHLASAPSSPAQRAQAVQAALDAALADDSGGALDRQLLAHGAPARPLREQPIRWHKRRPEGTALR
jgi:indolepyruvate ferredoxin oxidoreductase beta subunit